MSSLSVALVLAISLGSAQASNLLFARNNPPQPPCVYPYTDFVYSGCYLDSTSSRSLPFVAEMEFTNATVQQCIAYCKGNNYRYAGLEYYGQCYCGASVSSGKALEADCNLPCNGDNSQACGGHDRLSVYQDPTFPDADAIAISSDYLSLGCYTEGSSGRSLDYSQWDYLNISAMTTETCLDACGSKGYPFAGTEFGRECYCGVVLGNGTLPADGGECSTTCTGNSTQYCGGPDRLSLYVAKNLESTEPCAPPVLSSSSVHSSTTSPPSSKSTSTAKTSTTSKCVGWKCPPTTSCKTHKPTPPKSTSTPKCTTTPKVTSTPKTTKSSTLKTSTKCKSTSTPKHTTAMSTPKSTPKTTVKSTSTKKGYGHGGW
ncbi:WSC-domain-containing protein [Polyplosphaeria fusca]|uniref:WSC-domain-containing protein n=1 Tax=Polyplosphaeria fusca TaxID=682080 RepID=A0A9P4QS75_9PLEO|nr:WSC-domain-containing protein [Polyplosphaeria fusca]